MFCIVCFRRIGSARKPTYSSGRQQCAEDRVRRALFDAVHTCCPAACEDARTERLFFAEDWACWSCLFCCSRSLCTMETSAHQHGLQGHETVRIEVYFNEPVHSRCSERTDMSNPPSEQIVGPICSRSPSIGASNAPACSSQLQDCFESKLNSRWSHELEIRIVNYDESGTPFVKY